MPTGQEKIQSDPTEVARSIELLSTDPTQYGRALAQEAFDEYIASRSEEKRSTDRTESD